MFWLFRIFHIMTIKFWGYISVEHSLTKQFNDRAWLYWSQKYLPLWGCRGKDTRLGNFHGWYNFIFSWLWSSILNKIKSAASLASNRSNYVNKQCPVTQPLALVIGWMSRWVVDFHESKQNKFLQLLIEYDRQSKLRPSLDHLSILCCFLAMSASDWRTFIIKQSSYNQDTLS